MGPLAGIRIIEFAGIGPCPMAAMMLAEMGADVLRIDRVADSDLGIPLATKYETLKRSRHIIRLDLKRPEAVAMTLRLIDQSDALIEGFRPKVMERLGSAPKSAWRAIRAWCSAASPAGARKGRWRTPPATTSTTSRLPVHCTRSAAPAPRRRRLSIWSAISAAARSISLSACSPRSSRLASQAGARWSTPPWWMARHRS